MDRSSQAETASQRRLNPIGVVNQHMRNNTSDNYGQQSGFSSNNTCSTHKLTESTRASLGGQKLLPNGAKNQRQLDNLQVIGNSTLTKFLPVSNLFQEAQR